MRTSPGMTPVSTNTSQTRPASFTGPGCSSISPATPIGRMLSPTSTRRRNEPAWLATAGNYLPTTHRQVDDEGNRCDGPGGGNGRDDAGGAARAAGGDKRRRRSGSCVWIRPHGDGVALDL